MTVRGAVLLCVVLLFGSAAFAQESKTYAKMEIGVAYSYTRFSPESSSWTNGTFPLNGGGGDITYFLTQHFGIKGEFQGTTSKTRILTVPSPPCAPSIEPPCLVPAKGNLVTYNAMAVYKARKGKFEPYVEGGLGGAHSNTYLNFATACGAACVNTVKKPSTSGYDFVIGGGFDFLMKRHIAIRPAQFDIVLTRFGTGFASGNQNQTNFRYQAGVVFLF